MNEIVPTTAFPDEQGYYCGGQARLLRKPLSIVIVWGRAEKPSHVSATTAFSSGFSIAARLVWPHHLTASI
jgi:hypothetical protein